MAKLVILDRKGVPINAAGLKYVKPPIYNFKIEVELDKKIEKEAGKDPLLQQEFKDEANKVLEQTVATIEQKCKVFDKLFEGMISKGEDPKVVQKNLDGLNAAIKQDIAVSIKGGELAVAKAWTELQTQRKEWKGFKIKIGVSIVGTLATLAVSIAALAASPWSGGASGAFAIIGLIKVGVKIAQDIKRIAIDIDGAKIELIGHLKVVETAAKNKGVFAANEVTGAIFNEFLGISQPTIKSADTCFGTFKAKYAQLVVNVHDLAKTLEKILSKQADMKKEFFAEVDKRAAKHPAGDKAKKDAAKVKKQFETALDKNAEKVTDSITTIHKLYADTKAWAPEVKKLSARMAELKLKDMKGLKIFREALKFAMLGLAPIDGNAIATTATSLGLGIGGAVGGYAYDKITNKALEGTIWDAA